MRHIKKDYNTSFVAQHNEELRAAQLDEANLLHSDIYPGESGRKLFKKVRDIMIIPNFWDLKHQMYDEQGGLCCYCGLRIYENTVGRKQTVEHLISKGTNRELVGEYKNLLLSCSVTEDDAALLGVISTAHPDLKHCGESKGNMSLHYTPLQPQCETAFRYDSVGLVHGIDSNAEADIQTLNLNCHLLRTRRQAALSILFDADGNLLSDTELQMIMDSMTRRDLDRRLPEFCFVIRQVAHSLIR